MTGRTSASREDGFTFKGFTVIRFRREDVEFEPIPTETFI